MVRNLDDCLIMNGIKNNEYFYFLNSYCVGLEGFDKNYKACTSIYANQEFVSLVEFENLIGTQFHPEKSGKIGLKLIENFIRK